MSAFTRHFAPLVVVAAILSIAIAGCATSRAPHISSTVTMANQPGTNVENIMPIVTPTYSNVITLNTIRLMFVPLYQFKGTSGSLDPAISIAEAPRFSNGNRTVSVQLKRYKWSTGQPVTARDVQFWENLVVAAKTKWSEYVPGQYPDNVTSFSVTGEYTFTITFNQTYNQTWLLRNALAWITPLPQFSWDKTSASGAVGNFDLTQAGAAAVYSFLANQSTSPGTYTSSPIWKVVDGPYRLAKYVPSSGYLLLAPNAHYSGAPRPTVSLAEVPFTSSASEYSVLRGGGLDYGYVPAEDLATAGYFASKGFVVAPWYGAELNFVVLNYDASGAGPLFHQAYIREALQELINEPSYVRTFLHGYGHPTYGPVPSFPLNNYTSAAQSHPKFTYSPSRAQKLLSAHGWARNAARVLTCLHPGTGLGECGAGISGGQALTLKLLYTSGSTAATNQSAAFQSSAARVGIGISLSSLPFGSIFSAIAPASRTWQMAWWGGANSSWNFLQDYPVPSQTFASNGSFNLGSYASAQMDRDLTLAISQNGNRGLLAASSYGADTVANLWMPIQPYQISVVRKSLHGALPQFATEMVYPQLWSMSG